jgi:PAS domain S-box-containing protein
LKKKPWDKNKSAVKRARGVVPGKEGKGKKQDKMKQAKKKTISIASGTKKNGQKVQGKKENDLRVLILEDNPVDAELMARQLNKDRIDFAAQRVDTRNEFLKALKAFQPDLILADYKLPKFDALQALVLRNKIAPLTPFIVVTGSISEETAVECMKQGADDYLLKDRLARLGEAVRRSLANHSLQAEINATAKALRDSEALYRNLFENSLVSISQALPNGHLIRCNLAYARMYGYSSPEEILTKVTDIGQELYADPNDRERIMAILKAKGAMGPTEIQVRHRDGTLFTVLAGAREVRDADGQLVCYQAEHVDVSLLKQTEAALRQSEEQFRSLYENATIGMYRTTPEGRILMANPSLVRMLGFDDFADLARRDLEKNGFDAGFTRSDFRNQVEADGLVIGRESAWKQRDGAIAFIRESARAIRDTSGRTVFYEGTVEDVSARHKAEDAQRESEEHFRTMTERSPFGIVLIELAGRWIYVNPRFTELTGFKLADVPDGRAWFAKAFPEHGYRHQIIAEWKRDYAAITSGRSLKHQYQVRTNGLGDRYFAITTTSLAAERVILVFDDVTEMRLAEEQIRASLHEKEVLLKEIHHRVKNNLQVISGLLTLQAAQTNDERLQRMVKESQSRIWTMALIHQTLYQSGNLADIDMADYIHSLVGNLLSSHAQVAMPPAVIFDLLPVRLAIDRAIPLALIINELVTNAMKHAFPDGRPGEIRIALQKCRDKLSQAAAYELIVTDNGAGLPAGFDAAKQKSLGLQLVAMLTKQLGASLAIESAQGTSVCITFSDNEKN